MPAFIKVAGIGNEEPRRSRGGRIRPMPVGAGANQELLKAAGLRREMELAVKVQLAMTPRFAPEIPGLVAVGWTRAASIAGGDCYDLWQMPDRRMGIFLADASGHGIAPAMVVSQARTLVRALADVNCDPTWLLTRVNSRLHSDLEPGWFVTVFVGCLSAAGELRWSSAGHGPIFLRPRAGAAFQLLRPLAPPIGVSQELGSEPTASVKLELGGKVVVMSDGVFEARSPAHRFFGVDRVLGLLNHTADRPPAQMLPLLRDSVLRWQGKEEPADDQTVVIAQYRGA